MTFADALTRSRDMFTAGESAYRHGTTLDVSGYPRSEQTSYWLGVRSAHVYRPVAPEIPRETAADRGSEGNWYRGLGSVKGSFRAARARGATT